MNFISGKRTMDGKFGDENHWLNMVEAEAKMTRCAQMSIPEFGCQSSQMRLTSVLKNEQRVKAKRSLLKW